MRATWRLRNSARLMALSFQNQSRTYDATRRAVRFLGNDSAMEASFFVSGDALKRIRPDMRFDEARVLRAFDLNRQLIYAAAAKVYGRGHRGSYDLLSDDF
jgi:Protein of unknown function (DUF1488)